MPFAGGSMEGVDEFTPPAPPSADGRVRTSGPDAYVFTAFDSCAGWCDGLVRYSKVSAALLLLYYFTKVHLRAQFGATALLDILGPRMHLK